MDTAEQQGSAVGEAVTKQLGSVDGEIVAEQQGSPDDWNTAEQQGSAVGEAVTKQLGSIDGEIMAERHESSAAEAADATPAARPTPPHASSPRNAWRLLSRSTRACVQTTEESRRCCHDSSAAEAADATPAARLTPTHASSPRNAWRLPSRSMRACVTPASPHSFEYASSGQLGCGNPARLREQTRVMSLRST